MGQYQEYIYSAITSHGFEIKKLGVKKIGVFGSTSRGDMKDASDIDVIVEFIAEKKNFDNYMDLSYLLEDILQRKIDLVTPEALSENLKKHIMPEVRYIEI